MHDRKCAYANDDRKCAYANDDLSKDPRSKYEKFKGLIAKILTRCQMQYLAGSV